MWCVGKGKGSVAVLARPLFVLDGARLYRAALPRVTMSSPPCVYNVFEHTTMR